MLSTKRALGGTPISRLPPSDLLGYVGAMKSVTQFAHGHNHLAEVVSMVNAFAKLVEPLCQSTSTLSATNFDTAAQAARAVDVIYHHDDTSDHLTTSGYECT